MCDDCWSRYEPVPVTPAIKTAVAWLCALYEHHPTGGWLHVWVDDWNLPLNTDLADEVRETEERQASGNHWFVMPPPDEVETACWNAMKALTEAEQATALAIYDGYHLREETDPDPDPKPPAVFQILGGTK